jgi:hypothetical protein
MIPFVHVTAMAFPCIGFVRGGQISFSERL